jgi:thimet oligopeptidase
MRRKRLAAEGKMCIVLMDLRHYNRSLRTAKDISMTLATQMHPWDGTLNAAQLKAWVEAHLALHSVAIEALLAVAGERTVENTLAVYDAAVFELNLAVAQAGVLDSVAADKELRDQAQAMAKQIAQAGTALSLNCAVYKALQAVKADGHSAATRYYLQRTLLGYRLAGVDKDDATRERLSQLQEKATKLSLEFGRNVQECIHTVTVASAAELDGLPADYIARHKPAPDGSLTLTTDQPDMQPVMTFAHNHELRKRMLTAYNTRAYPANKQVLLALLSTREEIARTLGFESWANLATADQMIGSASAVRELIARLEEVSREGAAREYARVLKFAQSRQPDLAEIDMASRAYWFEQFRRAGFAFDSQEVRPYFPYKQVEAGVLATAAKLFRVEFNAAPHLAKWHEDVSAFEVYDQGRLAGRFYLDMHPREGKDKWFSATPVVIGAKGRALPEAALLCNFPRTTETDPGLLQYSDVVTFFHEFGHLMHAILGGHTEWAGQSGFATEGDFVEVPSQMLEEFFRDARLLQSFAKHWQTGEALPAATVARMNRASAFGRADWVRSQLFYTALSLEAHDQPAAALDLDALMKRIYERTQPYTWLDGNRMYASFTHLTGYSSNYYTYAYDKVIALDCFKQFDAADLLAEQKALEYRRKILEPGGSKPGRELILEFLGREQQFSAFADWIGEEFVDGA